MSGPNLRGGRFIGASALLALLLAAAVAAAVTPLPDCAHTPPAPGAVLHYAMNLNDLDLVGNRINDCAGVIDLDAMLGEYDVPDANDPALAPDPHGEAPLAAALDFTPGAFTGAVRYLEVPHHIAYKSPRFTWAVWLNAASFGAESLLLGVHDVAFRGGVALEARRDPGCPSEPCRASLRMLLECPQRRVQADSPLLLEPGRWHHVAGGFDGHAVRVYVDGGLAAETLHAPCLQWSDHRLDIGARNGLLDKPFPGRLDDVRLYDSALDPAAIEGLARGGPQ